MNEKTIITPDQDGVANLEIRRMQSRLEEKDKPLEMNGHMPAEAATLLIKNLREMIECIEKGEVSSVSVVTIFPDNKVSRCFLTIKKGEESDIDELFHMSLGTSGFKPEDSG